VGASTNQRINESAKVQINLIDDQIDVRITDLGLEALAGSWPLLSPAKASNPISNYRQASTPTSDPNLPLVTRHFQLSSDSFFQVNSSLISTLVEQAITKLDPKNHEVILDAYCGVGLFTRFIAPQVDRVIGIESSPSAIADAKQNLREFKNVKLYRGLVEKFLPTINDAIDAAVVDPPRSGCGPQTVRALIDHRVQRIVYVSCDPSTLARDARQLIDGGYHLIEVQPIDLFPQTYHIESVALFVRVEE
jgi:23S rRNA (uracil1939-C5)-methyltransferase